MFKHLAMAAACAGLIACGGTQESEQFPQVNMDGRELVSVGEMLAKSPDGKVTVDMRTMEQSFRVEKGLDHSAITIICPSSRVMPLDKFIPEVAYNAGKSPADYAKGFTMIPFMAGSLGEGLQKSAPVCSPGCDAEREPDGSWTCMC